MEWPWYRLDKNCPTIKSFVSFICRIDTKAREKWQRVVKLVNEFVITAGTLVQYDPSFKEEIRDLNSMLTTYLSEKKKINHIEQLKRLTKQVYVTIKKAKEKDSITQGLSMQLKSVVDL